MTLPRTEPEREEAVREIMTHADWLRACAAWCPDHADHLNEAADHLEEVERDLERLSASPASGGVDAVGVKMPLNEKALDAACEAVLAVPDHPGDKQKIRDAIATYIKADLKERGR